LQQSQETSDNPHQSALHARLTGPLKSCRLTQCPEEKLKCDLDTPTSTGSLEGSGDPIEILPVPGQGSKSEIVIGWQSTPISLIVPSIRVLCRTGRTFSRRQRPDGSWLLTDWACCTVSFRAEINCAP
jgi:hypothetical protein